MFLPLPPLQLQRSEYSLAVLSKIEQLVFGVAFPPIESLAALARLTSVIEAMPLLHTLNIQRFNRQYEGDADEVNARHIAFTLIRVFMRKIIAPEYTRGLLTADGLEVRFSHNCCCYCFGS